MMLEIILFAALCISGVMWGLWRYQQGRRRGYNEATTDFVTALKKYKVKNNEERNDQQ